MKDMVIVWAIAIVVLFAALMYATATMVTVKTDRISGANYVEYDDSIYKLVPLIEKGR